MANNLVLIDSSAWFNFFRGKEPALSVVQTLLKEKRACICGPVATEIVQGIKNSKEASGIKTLLAALPQLEITWDTWLKAGELSLSHRNKGITFTLPDLLIATVAHEYNVPLFTFDSGFEMFENLTLYSLPK